MGSVSRGSEWSIFQDFVSYFCDKNARVRKVFYSLVRWTTKSLTRREIYCNMIGRSEDTEWNGEGGSTEII